MVPGRARTATGGRSGSVNGLVVIVLTVTVAPAPVLGYVVVPAAGDAPDRPVEDPTDVDADRAVGSGGPTVGGPAAVPGSRVRVQVGESGRRSGRPVGTDGPPESTQSRSGGTNRSDVGRTTARGSAAAGGAATRRQTATRTVYFGSGTDSVLNDRSKIHAVDAATGQRRWNRSVRGDVDSAPTAVNGTVYVTADGLTGGSLRAVDAADGSLLWSRESSTTLSSPTVVGGTVYLAGGFGQGIGGEEGLYALDATNGSTRWRFPALPTATTPTVVDGTAYIATQNISLAGPNTVSLYALDAETGVEQWNRSWRGIRVNPPTATGDTVYLGVAIDEPDAGGSVRDGVVYAVDATDGAQRWSFSTPTAVGTAPTVVGGSVYVGTGDDPFGRNSSLYAVDATNGTEEWSYDTDNGVGAAPTVADGTVYTSDGNRVYALRADSGTERWTFEGPGDSIAPTVANGTLYIGDDAFSGGDGLYAIDAATGELRWQSETAAGVASAPTVVEDPVDGRSIDSRVLQGTLGHHGFWANRNRRGPAPIESVTVDVVPEPGVAGQAAVLTANVAPPEASVDGYRWDFDDGSTARGHRVTHSFDSAGEYNVTVAVVREGTTVATANRTVRVIERAVTEPTVLGVQVDPSGPLPDLPRVNKTVEAVVAAPDGIDRVVFGVGDDTYVDTDGSDGWNAVVPLSRYAPGTDVTVRAVGSNGETDTVTRRLGVAGVGDVIQYIVENAEETSVATQSQPEVEPTARRLTPDRIRYALVWPPSFAPSSATFLVNPVKFGFELGGEFTSTIYTERGSVQVGGSISGQLTIPSPPAAVRGTGRITARNQPDGGARFETDLARVRLALRAGFFREFDVLSYRGVGFSGELFFGPLLKLDAKYDEDGFPLNPSGGNLEGGIEASGNVEADLKALRVVGTLSGSGRAQQRLAGLSPSEILNAKYGLRIIFRGRAEGFLLSQRLTETFEFGTFPESSTATAADLEPNGTSYRRHNGTVPLADDSRLGTADDTTATRGLGNGPLDRLTEDGYADESPALAATGAGYLLAWDRQSPDRAVPEGHDIYTRGANATGEFVRTVRVTNDSRADAGPEVATGDSVAVLAWTRLNRTFSDASSVTVNETFAAREVAVARATIPGEGQTPHSWTRPRLLTDGSGAAFRPRLGHDAGRYYVAWEYDEDGDFRSLADVGVRYATYNVTNGSMGAVTTLQGATTPRIAGATLAYFQPDTPGGENGTVVVRNLTTGAEHRVRVTAFEDLAVTAGTAVWVAGEGRGETVRYYDAGGSAGTVPTPAVSGVDDIELVTRRIQGEGPVEALVFDARGRPAADTTDDAAVFYRPRRGDSWGRSQPLTTGGTDLTFLDIAAAGREDRFVAAFAAENVSASTEQPDLFAARHDYTPDLAVSATIPSGLAPGEVARIDWTVRNDGGAAARNVTVGVETADGRRLALSGAGAIDVGGRTNGSVTTTVPRSPTLTVRASDADGSGSDSTELTVLRPDLQLGTVERAPAPGGVAYRVPVRNTGAATTRNVTPAVTSNGRRIANASIGSLAPGESVTVRLVVASNRTNGGLVTRIRADPGNRIVERDESTGTRRVAPPRPDLFVTAIGSRATIDAESSRINVTVGNRGVAGATATVRVTAGNRSVTRSVTLAGTEENSTRFETVRLPLTGLGIGGREAVTVSVTPTALDARPADNVVRITVEGTAPDPDGDGTPARDPDRDGLYEDVNGDGTVNVVDVAVLLESVDGPEVSDDPAAFDFKPDGRVNVLDVASLLASL